MHQVDLVKHLLLVLRLLRPIERITPTNTIRRLFKSVVEEYERMGADYKIACVISNEICESNFDHTTIFSADITIINIIFLSASMIQSNVEYFNNIMHADVVFDEYHEFVSVIPLFALF